VSLKEYFDALGISAANSGAGFIGGLVSVFFNQRLKPFDIVGALVGGTATATYLGPPISDLTHMPIGATCFIVGFAGLQIVAQLALFVRNKIPGGTDGKNVS